MPLPYQGGQAFPEKKGQDDLEEQSLPLIRQSSQLKHLKRDHALGLYAGYL